MIERNWYGCYNENWAARGLPPEAISHPAKMGPKLAIQIIRHGLEQGWWKPGDVIADPFGGIGTTGLVAAWHGLRSVLVELEPRFFRCAVGHDCPGLTPDEWQAYRGRWHEHPDLCPRCGRKDAFEKRNDPPLGYGIDDTCGWQPHTAVDGEGHDYRPFLDFRPWKAPHHYKGVWETLLDPRVHPMPVMFLGDSRFDFAWLVGEAVAVFGSPPFGTGDSAGAESLQERQDKSAKAMRACQGWKGGGQVSPGQIGAMKPGKVPAVFGSPPFMQQQAGGGLGAALSGKGDYPIRIAAHTGQPSASGLGYRNQGDSPGQIGAMKPGEVPAVFTSPPYSNMAIATSVGGQQVDPKLVEESLKRKARGERGLDLGKSAQREQTRQYGVTEGQIGAMKPGKVPAVFTSPPYADSIKGAHEEKETAKETREKRRTEGGSLGISQRSGGYGTTEGNIGALPAGNVHVVGSPPWENQAADHAAKDTPGKDRLLKGANPGNIANQYGHSEHQIGNTKGETYWAAVKLVYEQCWQVLNPGGVIVLVVKAYVSKGKIVPLPEQTFALLRSIGFEALELIVAWQVERTEEEGLLDEPVVEEKSHIGFFRRLANAKGPAIENEVVMVMQRP